MKKIIPKSNRYGEDMPMMAKESPKIYPTFNIDLAHLPEAENWQVGQTYHIGLQIRQTGIHKNKNYGDASFEIVGIEVLKGQKKNKKPKTEKVERY